MQPQVPIFYSLAQPGDFLAPKAWLFLFPIISVFVTIFHFSSVHFLQDHEQVIPKLFAWSTVVVQVMFAIAFFRIILIIT